MTPREQTIAIGAVAFVIVLIIVLPIMAASGRISRLEDDVADGKRQQRSVLREIEVYTQKQAQLTALQKALTGGYDPTIKTTVESIADSSGIKDRIDSQADKKTPSDFYEELSDEVGLRKVTLQQLVDFLYAIENSPASKLKLKQLSVKPVSGIDKQELNATVTVATYKLLEEEGKEEKAAQPGVKKKPPPPRKAAPAKTEE